MERPDDQEGSLLSTLNHKRTPKLQRKPCAIKKLMDDVFEWTFPSPKGLILPPPESTWDAQLIVEVVTAKAVAVAAEEEAAVAAAADIVVVTAMEVAEEAMETVAAVVVAVMVVALLLLTTEAVLEGIIGPVPDPILLVGTDSIWGPRETGGGYIFQIKLAHYQTFLFSWILPNNLIFCPSQKDFASICSSVKTSIFGIIGPFLDA